MVLGFEHKVTLPLTDQLDGQKWNNSNALTGNNLGVGAQQNGECLPTFEQPPTDTTIPRAER